ncbi:ABC transporter ATP-binding protein [Atlantibacter subterranea]|uniref:ABC transporter ATP-binding protein n=1 Tax=Atlantibacter subterraneus TaxID=255519 RepID=A0A427V5G4_9ENTR|nr:ABC transporter ATP-binding protein [Atlantibacter subterranea]MDA3134654.1 ABC transporter ATP-binding protein [Atlantibacter subterranea]RSB63814.1 ABC transporter ATP-binding protein [Atlantibacter subterranea]RSE06503.1 ABC transporter ATP-binding protein [Atlantibacter subterranea]RSE28006.1 ABC transporter ATP-binding protein [Atlantibacter subterranea]
MPLLELKNVGKEYDSQVVLERLNVSVEEGEFITIVGASGCGKTTFLKMLLGTESPSKGTFLLDGQPLAQEPDAQRGIVFQRYSVFPHLTVIENVMLAEEFSQARWLGRVWGRKRAAIREQARVMLKQVGLLGAQDKYPHQLSGGMQQRLALAQALMKQPRILLLDEPFGALDPGIRAEMHVLISSLWERHKLTIFMITHDLKEGFSLGSRLWVFDKVRHDPQAPEAYGASITYDIPLDRKPAGSVTPLFPHAPYPLAEQPAALFSH